MSAPILPRDEAAREKARTDLASSFLVEAGAGTGKTSLIVERIANLVESGVALEKIVAITFTEKAAGELKMRVRQALESRGTPRAVASLGKLERASISTIHAWCASLLRAYPVEAGVDPLFSVLDANASTTFFERCWEEWLGRELSRSGSGRVPLVDLPGFTTEWWIGQLEGVARFLVRERTRVPHALPEPTAGDPSERLAEAFSRADFGAYVEESVDRSDTMIAALEKSRYARDAFLRMQPTERIATLFGQKAFDMPSSYARVGNKQNWKGREGRLESARGALQEILERVREAQAIARHDLASRIVRWLAEGFVPHYEDEKRRVGALDFDDLLVKVTRMLRERPEVRAEVRRSIEALIVDEFQDTDPIQCEAAFLLTSETDVSDWTKARPKPGRLFLVGDPKQSIYAFRGADIETYSAARERLAASGSLLPISTNFRSRASVLAWVNAVFSKLIVAPETGRWQTSYAPLDAARETEGEGTGVHVVRPPEGAQYATIGASRDAEARTVAALLRDEAIGRWTVRDRKTGGDRVARWGDVVVLLRNRTSSLPAYERAFRAGGIPYVVVGGRALWERQEVRALTALARAIDNPFDQVSVVAALKSPFFGASDADLLLWRHTHGSFHAREDAAGVVGDALRAIADWHRARVTTQPYRLLERVIRETGALAAFGLKPDGAQRVANLLRIVDAARDVGDAFGLPGAPPSFRAFVHGLSERVRELREEAEAPVMEEEGDAVRVLTMHAAKGLEFPIVVLGDLAVGETQKEPRFVDPDSGQFAVRLGSKDLALETLRFEEAKAAVTAREKAEDMRLLYVAATRACDALVVPMFAPEKKAGPFHAALVEAFPALVAAPRGSARLAAGEGGPARLVDDVLPIEGDPPVFRISTDELEAALERTVSAPPPPLAISATLAARRSPRAVASVTALLAPAEGVAGAASLFAPDIARRIGTAVHRAVEISDLDDPDGLARAARAEAVAAALPPDAVTHAESLARNAAAIPSVARALASNRLLREWPFVLHVDGGALLEGVVDLAWVEDGALVVLDWKTDALSDPQAAADHHRPQVTAYAHALSEIASLPVKEIVLAFLAGPREVRIAVTDAELSASRAAIASALRR